MIKTSVFTDDFNRADSSVGSAGNTTAVGNSWKDVLGSVWHIATNKLKPESGDYQFSRLERPSAETFIDGGSRATVVVSGGYSALQKLRVSGTNNSYAAWIALSNLYMTMEVNGVATTPVGSSEGVNLPHGQVTIADGTYIVEVYALKTSSGNKTTVVAKIYDSTGTTLLDSHAFTDTTANMQSTGLQAVTPLSTSTTVDDYESFTIPSRDGKTRRCTFDGNSWVAGTGASNAIFYIHAQLQDFIGPDWTVVNDGVNGDTLSNMSTEAPTTIDPNYDGAKDENWIIVWELTNTIQAGSNETATYSALQSYCQARKTAHPTTKIAVLTCMDREDGVNQATWLPAAQAVNVLINANAVSDGFCDLVIDLAADPRFTPDSGHSAARNLLYYASDRLHLADQGYMQVAIIISDALRDYINTNDTTPPTVTTASIDSVGTTLTINFSEAVTGFLLSDYAVTGGHTLSSASGSGSSRTMTISPGVSPAETLTLSYSGTTTADSSANALATFTGKAISNGSTAGLTGISSMFKTRFSRNKSLLRR